MGLIFCFYLEKDISLKFISKLFENKGKEGVTLLKRFAILNRWFTSLAILSGGLSCSQAGETVDPCSGPVCSPSEIVMDITPPAIKSVGASPGYFSAGDKVNIDFTFSEIVEVENGEFISVRLETGTVDRSARYASGSGTAILTFIYEVQEGDSSSDLEFSSEGVYLSGGRIRDLQNNTASMDLTGISLANSANTVIDTTPAEVTKIFYGSPADNYGLGATVRVHVEFDEKVTVTGGTDLALQMETGPNDTKAIYTEGSGTDTLIFGYTVVNNDFSSDLELGGLGFSTGASVIKDLAGNVTRPQRPQSYVVPPAKTTI